MGRLCEMATNFVLDKAKFAVECGHSVKILTQHKRKFGRIAQTIPRRNKSKEKPLPESSGSGFCFREQVLPVVKRIIREETLSKGQ